MTNAKTAIDNNEEPIHESIDEYPLPLDEFCASLSQTDRRVELIGAFYSVEKKSGRIKDVRSAYTKRFGKFAHTPA